MNIPRWVKSKLSGKNRENPRIKPAASSGHASSYRQRNSLRIYFYPPPPSHAFSKLCYFGAEHWQSLPLCCHHGEKKPQTQNLTIFILLTLYTSGKCRNSSNLSSLWCQLSGNTCFPRLSPHLKGPTTFLIMHFQEAPLFTNLVDKHMLYLNKYKRELLVHYDNTKLGDTRANTVITYWET